jgi:hypothetical protein
VKPIVQKVSRDPDAEDVACRLCGGGFGMGDKAVVVTADIGGGLIRKVFAHALCAEKKEPNHGP